MRMHGRNIVGLNTYKQKFCVMCGDHATVYDADDPQFLLCESCLLEWDIRTSGVTTVNIVKARKSLEIWYGNDNEKDDKKTAKKTTKKKSKQRKNEVAKALEHLKYITNQIVESEERGHAANE